MDKFFDSVQSFFHSVTTNDRYAKYEGSQGHQRYNRRTVSGGFGPAAPLTSGDESNSSTHYSPPGDIQHDNNPYSYSNASSRNGSTTNLANSSSNTSLNRMPYAPGMRSAQLGSSNTTNTNNIPLQEYNDGLPPPPPAPLSWKRIDRWLEANYPELGDQLEDGVTVNDLNQFENDVGCTLPDDVRDSFFVHDGQEKGSRPTGLIFGITLLDLEAVELEWQNWKNTAIKVANMAKAAHANKLQQQQQSGGSAAGPSNAQPGPSRRPPPGKFRNGGNLAWLDSQESVPDGAIQKVYAHPSWIPLATDYLGNNIAIDLAPGPNGRWGQVILFGREYDRKFVVASSWASFLMTFADDLENGNHYINDETEDGELSFRASNGRIIPYFDVLKSRTERLYRPARRPQPPTQTQQTHPYGSMKSYPNTGLASGNRVSPRNSMGNAPAVRNVSGNFRRPVPNGIANSAREGHLISPMSSTSNLPSTGLTKTQSSTSSSPVHQTADAIIEEPEPSQPAKTTEQKPERELTAQQSKPESKSLIDDEDEEEENSSKKDDKKSTEEVETTKKDKADTTDEKPSEEAPKKEESKETITLEKESELKTETDKTTDKKDDKQTKKADEKKEETAIVEAKETTTEKPDAKDSEVSKAAEESEDEVDLLKDDLAEVAI